MLDWFLQHEKHAMLVVAQLLILHASGAAFSLVLLTSSCHCSFLIAYFYTEVYHPPYIHDSRVCCGILVLHKVAAHVDLL
jgi:hypothetical protein